jgi:rubrerythrin
MDEKAFVDAVEMAIENEIEAYEFYQGVATQVSDEDMKELFLHFAEEESKHKSLLENVLIKGSFDLIPKETRDYKVSEAIDLPKLSTDMKPEDAIVLAMKKEEVAMKHYSDLAEVSADKDLKKLFEDLAGMEREHKFKLENVFVERGYPEVW